MSSSRWTSWIPAASVLCFLCFPLGARTAGERPAAPLDAFRQVEKEAQEAIRTPDLRQRVKRLEEFLAAHPDHPALKKPLQALLDAYTEVGIEDPSHVGTLVVRLAKERKSSYQRIRLMESYVVKYALPLESGREVLRLAREKLEEERREAEKTRDGYDRNRRLRFLHYRYGSCELEEARLALIHDRAAEATEALDRAERHYSHFPVDVSAVDPDGRVVRSYPSTYWNDFHLTRAMVDLRLGHRDEARAEAGRILGTFDSSTNRKWYRELAEALNLAARQGPVIRGEPIHAADFTLKDLDGKEVRLSGQKGKIVLISFWATWCYWCGEELPVLTRFVENHPDQVTLFAVNTDEFESRPKIRPWLEEHNLSFRVLLEDPEALAAYPHEALPTLYIVDRDGMLADKRVGFDSELKEKLDKEMADLVAGKGAQGRELVRVENAPAGFGLLWKARVQGPDPRDAWVAEPVGEQPGEVGAVGSQGLLRWSAEGKALETHPLTGWNRGVSAADLDASGTREWIVRSWGDFSVLDSTGETYWKHEGQGRIGSPRFTDLDGDGLQELVFSEGDKIVAEHAVPTEAWSVSGLEHVETVHLGPGGGILVQAGRELRRIGRDGKLEDWKRDLPAGRVYAGWIRDADGTVLDLLRGNWLDDPFTRYDVDGDGRNDLVLTTGRALAAYDPGGREILRITAEEDASFHAVLGNLDGRPGDEVVLFVEGYGPMVFGSTRK